MKYLLGIILLVAFGIAAFQFNPAQKEVTKITDSIIKQDIEPFIEESPAQATSSKDTIREPIVHQNLKLGAKELVMHSTNSDAELHLVKLTKEEQQAFWKRYGKKEPIPRPATDWLKERVVATSPNKIYKLTERIINDEFVNDIGGANRILKLFKNDKLVDSLTIGQFGFEGASYFKITNRGIVFESGFEDVSFPRMLFKEDNLILEENLDRIRHVNFDGFELYSIALDTENNKIILSGSSDDSLKFMFTNEWGTVLVDHTFLIVDRPTRYMGWTIPVVEKSGSIHYVLTCAAGKKRPYKKTIFVWSEELNFMESISSMESLLYLSCKEGTFLLGSGGTILPLIGNGDDVRWNIFKDSQTYSNKIVKGYRFDGTSLFATLDKGGVLFINLEKRQVTPYYHSELVDVYNLKNFLVFSFEDTLYKLQKIK